MIWFLRIAFSLILAAMAVVTVWASLQVPIWQIPPSVGGHPWFVATLFDTYFAFLTFWAWVAYKENSHIARIAWLLAILLLGNFAMAAYMLIQLWKLSPGDSLDRLVLKR